ncbi:hypothetical protein ACQ5SK_29730 [Bradyrhizobium japonicum]
MFVDIVLRLLRKITDNSSDCQQLPAARRDMARDRKGCEQVVARSPFLADCVHDWRAPNRADGEVKRYRLAEWLQRELTIIRN